jgi:integrase
LSISTLHARVGKRLPVVFSRDEAQEVLLQLNGEFRLMASLLYGSGLRLTECLKLRIKDIDFSLNEIIVRAGKGDNDHWNILPKQLIPHLKSQIGKAKIRLKKNMFIKDFTGASIPEALERKYPCAPIEPA